MIRGKTLRNTLLVLAALALAVFLAVSFGLFSPSAHMWPNRVTAECAAGQPHRAAERRPWQ